MIWLAIWIIGALVLYKPLTEAKITRHAPLLFAAFWPLALLLVLLLAVGITLSRWVKKT